MKRRRRSNPARFLALMALVGAVVAIVVVVQGTTADSSSSGSAKDSGAKTASPQAPGRFRQDTYRVRKGDTLGLISSRSGIEQETLLKLNPGLDANSLNAGQRIKLRKPAKKGT